MALEVLNRDKFGLSKEEKEKDRDKLRSLTSWNAI